MNDEERAEQGMAVRRAVLGDAHVDRAVASTSQFTAPFQDWITRYAWGEIWSRPGLTRPERSIVTLTVLAALQHEDELHMHVKAALRNGLTEEQIQEVLLQVGLYAGVPGGEPRVRHRRQGHQGVPGAGRLITARSVAKLTGPPLSSCARVTAVDLRFWGRAPWFAVMRSSVP